MSVVSPGSSHPTSAVSSVFSPTNGPSPMSPISEWPSPISACTCKPSWQEYSPHLQQPMFCQLHRPATRPFVGNLWLYTCVNEGKRSTRLRHLDVSASKVSSDRDLALMVSSLYAHMHKGWAGLLRLRGLLGIRFAQVSMCFLRGQRVLTHDSV
jgi:hypothetical protein